MQRRQSPAYGASSLRARYRDPRGAYAPRSWSRRRNCDFCDAQTDMHRSGACKPAVARRRTCKENRKPQVGAHSRSISSGGRQTAEVAVATPQRRSTRHSHATIAPGNSSGGRKPAVARRRTCKENRKPQVGARSRSISSVVRQPTVVAATAIAMRSADARSAVSRIWSIVLASAFP